MRTATLKLTQTKRVSLPEEVSILLIEDATGDAAAITKALVFGDTMDSFKVQCKTSLATGLDFLAKEKVDIVLLDLGLPDADALTALKAVHSCFPELPIVIITGYYSIDRMNVALRQGAQEFLIKGECSAAVIRQSIYQAIARKKMELALAKEGTLPAPQMGMQESKLAAAPDRDLTLHIISEDSVARQLPLRKEPHKQPYSSVEGEIAALGMQSSKRLVVTYHYINGLRANMKDLPSQKEEHIRLLSAYIEKSGCNVPLLVDHERNIVAGHAWLQAARFLDLEMLPTLCVDQLTRAQTYAFMRADSYLSDVPVWTDELVAKYLKMIADMNLSFTLEIPALHFAGIPMVVMSRLYALLLSCNQNH